MVTIVTARSGLQIGRVATREGLLFLRQRVVQPLGGTRGSVWKTGAMLMWPGIPAVEVAVGEVYGPLRAPVVLGAGWWLKAVWLPRHGDGNVCDDRPTPRGVCAGRGRGEAPRRCVVRVREMVSRQFKPRRCHFVLGYALHLWRGPTATVTAVAGPAAR